MDKSKSLEKVRTMRPSEKKRAETSGISFGRVAKVVEAANEDSSSSSDKNSLSS
jgi:hypothetical protein